MENITLQVSEQELVLLGVALEQLSRNTHSEKEHYSALSLERKLRSV